MEAHIGQYISQATEMQTLCWSQIRLSFSGADNSYISCTANRHVHQDQYPENGFHVSQDLVQ